MTLAFVSSDHEDRRTGRRRSSPRYPEPGRPGEEVATLDALSGGRAIRRRHRMDPESFEAVRGRVDGAGDDS